MTHWSKRVRVGGSTNDEGVEMVKYIADARFNFIDLVGIMLASKLFNAGNYYGVAAAIVCTVLVSVTCKGWVEHKRIA